MGIAAIRAEFIAAVRSVAPTIDETLPFVCREDGTGAIGYGGLDLLQPDTETRHFTAIVGTLPVWDENNGCYLVATLEVLIVYRADGDYVLSDDMMASDAGLIQYAMRQPSVWRSAETIHPEEPPSVEEIETEDGHLAIRVMRLPYRVTYREC